MFLKSRIGKVPEIALILGSGLAGIAGSLSDVVSIPYQDIPGFPLSTAPGHISNLICGKLNGTRIIMLQGRFHHYEGCSMKQLAFPIRVLKVIGCSAVVVTNASGGINREFSPGDLMLITDHINMTGLNPLVGPNDEKIGPRFPDLSDAYTAELQVLVREAAESAGIRLKEGVYAWMTGPSFETPAEIRMLAALGADAVGMSTVPEVITAAHSGLKVLSVSCISNMAAGILKQPVTAEEVMEIGKLVEEKFTELISRFLSLYIERN